MKITAIKQQLKRRDRYSLYVDGRYAFSLSEAALIESKLSSGTELTKEKLKEYKKLSADDKAYGMALRYAAMRLRSEREVADYLKRKAVEENVAKEILNKLSKIGLIDDAAFATAWVANRRLLKAVSRRRLIQELRQKHVASSIIDDVISEDKETSDERDILRQLIEKKRNKYADNQKLMAYLARQGYSYDDIKSVLNEED